jgi:ribosomal protein L36
MHYEDLFEPIEVVTYFREGKIIPLKFRWNGRVYIIRHVHGQWKQRQGYATQFYFSTRSDGADFFELMFDTGDFSWKLARVCIEG